MERLTKKCEYNYELYVKLPTVDKQEFLNKLGKFEDLLGNADSIRIIKRNGIASLHIDMILDNETYPIAEELFGKEKVEDYEK